MAQAAANSHRHGSTRQVADDMAWVTEDESLTLTSTQALTLTLTP